MAPSDEPAQSRNKLVAMLEDKLKTILKGHPKESAASGVSKVVAAFHDGKPGAVAILRAQLELLVAELSRRRPEKAESEHVGAAVLRAFAETAPLVEDFARLVTAVVDCRSEEGFEVMLEALGSLASAQSNTEVGASRAGDFEVQRLLVREVIMLVAAISMKNDPSWRFLGLLARHQFSYRFEVGVKEGGFAVLANGFPVVGGFELGRGAVDQFVGALRARYSKGVCAIQLKDLREADYFLHLAKELEGPAPDDFSYWFPFLFTQALPDREVGWIRRCKSKRVFTKAAQAAGLGEDVFKTRYEERWRRVTRLLGGNDEYFLNLQLTSWLLDPKDLGTTP